MTVARLDTRLYVYYFLTFTGEDAGSTTSSTAQNAVVQASRRSTGQVVMMRSAGTPAAAARATP